MSFVVIVSQQTRGGLQSAGFGSSIYSVKVCDAPTACVALLLKSKT